MYLSASASPSPGPVKMTPRMTTLHEECNFKEEETFLYPEEEEDSVLEEEVNDCILILNRLQVFRDYSVWVTSESSSSIY